MDDLTYAAVLRAAAMEALGMVYDADVASKPHDIAHKTQEPDAAAESNVFTQGHKPTRLTQWGMSSGTYELDATAQSDTSGPAREHSASLNQDIARETETQKPSSGLAHVFLKSFGSEEEATSAEGRDGNERESNRRAPVSGVSITTTDIGLTHGKQERSTAPKSASLIYASEPPVTASDGSTYKALTHDVAGHRAVVDLTVENSAESSSGTHQEMQAYGSPDLYGTRVSTSKRACRIRSGTAHGTEHPAAQALGDSTGDTTQSQQSKTRGRKAINVPPESTAEAGAVHDPKDLLSALHAAFCVGAQSDQAKKAGKKAEKRAKKKAKKEAEERTPDEHLLKASRLARTIGGRVSKTKTAVRVVKERVSRRLVSESVETEDDIPKLLKIVRKAFRPSRSSRRNEQDEPPSVMAHVLPLERLAKGDVVQIWTDGSGDQRDAGAAFVYRERDGTWRGQQFTLPNERDALVAEMTALHEALQFAQRLCAGKSCSFLVHDRTNVLKQVTRSTAHPRDPAVHGLSDELDNLQVVSGATTAVEIRRRKRAGILCLQMRKVLRGQRRHPQCRMGQRPRGRGGQRKGR